MTVLEQTSNSRLTAIRLWLAIVAALVVATLIVPRDFDLSPYFDIVKPPAPEIDEYRAG